MGIAPTRSAARQLVSHRHITVNGNKVNIPSYQVKAGDEIELTDGAKNQLRIKAALDAAERRAFPSWIEVDIKTMTKHQHLA